MRLRALFLVLLALAGLSLAAPSYCDNFETGIQECTVDANCSLVTIGSCFNNSLTNFTLSCGVNTTCDSDIDCPNSLPCNTTTGLCSFYTESAANCTCPDAGYNASGVCRICGNGYVNNATEQCDDGGYESGDGCDATCQCEPVSAAVGNLTTEVQNICIEGDLIVLRVNVTPGTNYTLLTAACYGTGTEFPGACSDTECLCTVHVTSDDMYAAISGSVTFSLDVVLSSEACPQQTVTVSSSLDFGLQDCGCSSVSECNPATTAESWWPAFLVGALILGCILIGIWISRGRRHHVYSQMPQ